MIEYSKTQNQYALPEIQGYKRQFTYTPAEQTVVEQPTEQTVVEQPTQVVEQQPTEEEIIEEQRVIPTTTTSSKRYTDRKEFLKDMTAAYTKALQARGIDTRYANYLAIQDALESNFGKSYAGNWNFGNITTGKSWKGSYTEGRDKDANGNRITQKFRNYDTIDQYVNNKIDLLSGKRYRAFNGDLSGFYDRVKAGGYAAAVNYAKNLNRLYNQYFPVTAKNGIKLPNILQNILTQNNKINLVDLEFNKNNESRTDKINRLKHI